MTLDGIVLAGGSGSRLGTPKATLLLGGVTLVERAVNLLRPHCDRVIVVSRDGVRLPPLAAEVVLDRPGPDSPLNALATGLEASAAEECLVLGCDMPFAGPLITRLAEGIRGQSVIGVDESGNDQPLCARYPRTATLALAEQMIEAESLSLRGLTAELAPFREPAEGDTLLNINTPGDLQRAIALVAQPGSTSTRAL